MQPWNQLCSIQGATVDWLHNPLPEKQLSPQQVLTLASKARRFSCVYLLGLQLPQQKQFEAQEKGMRGGLGLWHISAKLQHLSSISAGRHLSEILRITPADESFPSSSKSGWRLLPFPFVT